VNFVGVALRNTCNTLQQSAIKLIINTLTADNILSVTRYCQQFFCFGAKFLRSLDERRVGLFLKKLIKSRFANLALKVKQTGGRRS